MICIPFFCEMLCMAQGQFFFLDVMSTIVGFWIYFMLSCHVAELIQSRAFLRIHCQLEGYQTPKVKYSHESVRRFQ